MLYSIYMHIFNHFAKKNFLTFLLIVCIVNLNIFSQESNFKNFLKKEKIDYYTQQIVPVPDFEENYIIEINNNSEKTHYLFFTREFVFARPELFVEFVKNLKSINSNLNCTIVITASDYSKIPESQKRYFPGGTKEFASQVDNEDSCFAILVEHASPKVNKQKREIVSGGNKSTSPAYIVKSLKAGLQSQNLSPLISNYFAAFHSLELMKENTKLNYILDSNVPGAAVYLIPQESDYAALLETELKLSDSKKTNNETHYSFVNFLGQYIYLGESFLCILFIIFILTNLFVICFFTFNGNQKNVARKKDIYRSIAIIPAIILICTLTGFLVERIFFKLPDFLKYGNLIIFAFKIIAVTCSTLFIFSFQLKYNYLISSYAYGFLMRNLSMLNVIIFTFADIALFPLFLLEFICIFLSSRTKTLLGMALWSFISLLIFVPHFCDFIQFSSEYGLKMLASPGFIPDIFLALALTPVIIQLMRICIALDVTSIKSSDKKTIEVYITMIISSVIILLMYLFTCTFVRFNTTVQTPKELPVIVKDLNDENFKINFTESNFMGLTEYHLKIKNTGFDRINFVVQLNDGAALYDSNFDYTSTGKNKTAICIPDNPPANFELVYSTDTNKSSVIHIEAFTITDDAVEKFTRSYEVK